MSIISSFELRYMNIFAEEGIQMLPNSDRSAYTSDEDHEFAMFVHSRLVKFYALYKPEQTGKGFKDW